MLPFLRNLRVRILEGRTPAEKLTQEVADLLNRNRINARELREIGFERKSSPEDLASFLQKEGRHAVAHANRDPTINPDYIGDQRQMSVVASILRAAARSCIKSQFRIGENSLGSKRPALRATARRAGPERGQAGGDPGRPPTAIADLGAGEGPPDQP